MVSSPAFTDEPGLSPEERKALLQLARDSVVHAVTGGSSPPNASAHAIFQQRRGVFITLHVRQKLRGCIGVVEPAESLAEAVVRCAVCAAVQDSRFSPLGPDELTELRIEVSLLSALTPIRPEEIEIGRHGLLIACDGHRGVLLPQVAIEHHLSTEQFLAETCRKAGLPLVAWQDAASLLFAFTCEVFSDGV
jgi:AmmeMemoRadiSam system protein A